MLHLKELWNGRKVGEVFEVDGVKLKVVAMTGCHGCYFHDRKCYCKRSSHYDLTDSCISSIRKDGISIIYKNTMEERTIKLSLDKAKEYYNKGGELRKIALQAYRKDEMFERIMPKTWEAYIHNIYIDDIKKYEEVTNVYKSNICEAYSKLRYLREYYRQEWEPDWSDEEQTKYCIVENDGLEVEECYQNRQFLAFQTRELAEQFLDNFRDLIIKADIL